MNNKNKSSSRNRGGRNSAQGGQNLKKGKGSKNRRNRHFQKIVDTEHNESKYWTQSNWNNDNRGVNEFYPNEPVASAGIFPWIRSKPSNTLIIPKHINFDDQYEKNQQERVSNINNVQAIEPKVTKETTRINQENNVSKSENVTKGEKLNSAELNKSSPLPDKYLNINQKIDAINLKQEKTLSSSSSSSSSESSSESEPESNSKAILSVKSEIKPDSKPPSSPLNIKIKPTNNSVSSTSTKTQKSIPQTSSSSSSSSSDEESTPPPSEKELKSQNPIKSEPTNNKISSEDDVVCMGNLENKIVLEDESDKNSSEESETAASILNKISKNYTNNTSEMCLICDKNGHTSFQCQMICKNCSAPYHGYRTCPQPANLNTMLQLFMEFCMQQMQNFQVEKQTGPSDCNNVPKPKVDYTHLSTAVNKSNKTKRKQAKTNETNKKHKTSKKRKISASKKTNSKASRNESSDDDSDDDSDTVTSSTEIDKNISDSSAESLVSSKRKRKLKSKNSSKTTFDLSSFSANPLSLPMVLNGFSNLSIPKTTSVQNANTSAKALNTLLLTQMFQNAIDSLKK